MSGDKMLLELFGDIKQEKIRINNSMLEIESKLRVLASKYWNDKEISALIRYKLKDDVLADSAAEHALGNALVTMFDDMVKKEGLQKEQMIQEKVEHFIANLGEEMQVDKNSIMNICANYALGRMKKVFGISNAENTAFVNEVEPIDVTSVKNGSSKRKKLPSASETPRISSALKMYTMQQPHDFAQEVEEEEPVKRKRFEEPHVLNERDLNSTSIVEEVYDVQPQDQMTTRRTSSSSSNLISKKKSSKKKLASSITGGGPKDKSALTKNARSSSSSSSTSGHFTRKRNISHTYANDEDLLLALEEAPPATNSSSSTSERNAARGVVMQEKYATVIEEFIQNNPKVTKTECYHEIMDIFSEKFNGVFPDDFPNKQKVENKIGNYKRKFKRLYNNNNNL